MQIQILHALIFIQHRLDSHWTTVRQSFLESKVWNSPANEEHGEQTKNERHRAVAEWADFHSDQQQS